MRIAGQPDRITETYRSWANGDVNITGAAVSRLATDPGHEIAQIIIEADKDNGDEVYIGDVYTRTFKLEPGASVTLLLCRMDGIYISTISTAHVMWIALGDW